MQRNLLIAFFVGFFTTCINGNPAIQVEFNRAVDSNDCLKSCMTPVRESNVELSIFKRANYSDYLLNLDQICTIITNARHCIDRCGIQSNPFALISMNAICSSKARQDAKLLEPCLQSAGTQVHAQCVQVCGDYEAFNDQLHMDTSTLKPEDQQAIQSLNSQNNNACSVMKCAARCAVNQFNKQCSPLSNGVLAGDLIREMVERVLATHRMDLQVFGLLETMKKNTQPECNYLHTADVLFNPLKDILSQQVIRDSQKQAVEQPAPVQTTDSEQQMKSLASQLYVKILKKQLQVLNKQLEIMDKQEVGNELPRFMQNPPPKQFEGEMF